jgi:MOSC domain-containing protein YiiM
MTDGLVIGLARRAKSGAPMEMLERAAIARAGGLAGDFRGVSRTRQVTVLFAEDWRAACAALGREVDWTVRRANVLVSGVANPAAAGGLLTIGSARIRIRGETAPCAKMDKAEQGLRAALTPDWRGGVFGVVELDGEAALGDSVRWIEV